MHPVSNGYPIAVAMTADGFLNPSGAQAPCLMGAAVRTGLFRQLFDPSEPVQHVKGVSLQTVDDATLVVVYDVHSEAGEVVIEATLSWDPIRERPWITFRAAHSPRLDGQMGVIGANFMLGPRLFGRLADGSGQGGIMSFHDARSAVFADGHGSVSKSLLVPPVTNGSVIRQEFADQLGSGASITLDQPQLVEGYFSAHPGVPYEHRCDLRLEMLSASGGSMVLRRDQIAVDLESTNPEASETCNLSFAQQSLFGTLSESAFELQILSLIHI